MTNWEKNKSEMEKWGILAIDDVPKNIIDYLINENPKIKYNHRLAGHIKNEYSFSNWPKFIDKFVLAQTHKDLLKAWTERNETLSSNRYFYLQDLWINFQKKYEFNPIHHHSGLFSFIIFLKIPYDLKKEDEVFKVTPNGLTTSRLYFLVQDYMGTIVPLLVNVDKSFEGKMLMFPSKLQHGVYPFYTSDENRITVSGNLKFWVEGDVNV